MPHVRIVQPDAKPEDEGSIRTQGTKVYAGDTEIEGVYRIELYADLESVWRAVIHVHPKFMQMTAMADKPRVAYWSSIKWRFLEWVRGRHNV